MDFYFAAKTIHIISSSVLFGTGIGIAFFMFRSLFTNSIQEKHYAVKSAVIADYLFTLPAVIVQPLTGFYLIHIAGYDWTSFWLLATYVLYIFVGMCWLPVVLIQTRLRDMCKAALEANSDLPDRYHTLFKFWFFLGWPAFIGLIGIYFLMVVKLA